MDYQAQADRPFEHEERLKQLLTRQAELNSQLDLDKGDQQGAASAPEMNEELESEKAAIIATTVRETWHGRPKRTCVRPNRDSRNACRATTSTRDRLGHRPRCRKG